MMTSEWIAHVEAAQVDLAAALKDQARALDHVIDAQHNLELARELLEASS